MSQTLWDRIKYSLANSPTIKFTDFADMIPLEWVRFSEGIDVRKIPCGLRGITVLACRMQKGALLERHDHDYYETFTVTKGRVKDNISGVIMSPDGKNYSWRKGTPHEPDALEYSELLVFCQYE